MAISPIVSPQAMHTTSRLKGVSTNAATTEPSCTHSFDAWRAFALSYSAQQAVSGRYGLDFRFAPQPTGGERRTLRLLDTVANNLGPSVLERSAIQFDYLENAYARAQKKHPCATPSAHVPPSASSQPTIQPLVGPQIQQTISTSSSATPRASPEHRHRHQGYQHNQPDPLSDMFNFDLASPSEASAPPDTDIDQGNDTEGTDTESERLSDLEGPVALRRITGRRGRDRGARRGRAGSISTNSVSSGPGISPVSPSANNPISSAHYTSAMNTDGASSSALRPVYGRHPSGLAPVRLQNFSHSQPAASNSSQFLTSVSESGAGIVGPGAVGSNNPDNGFGSMGVSAGARARIRGRGIGTPRSEPDPDITPTNTAGATTGPVSGSVQAGGYSVGPFGYRYPEHPTYARTASEVSATHAHAHAQAYAQATRLGATSEVSLLAQSQSSQQVPNSRLNQQWQARPPTATTTTEYGIGGGMDIDVDMGGWGRISDPLPGMNSGYGTSGMQYSSPYSRNQTQTQMTGTYQSQAYSPQQSQYTQPPSHLQLRSGMTGVYGAHVSYYTSPTTASATTSPSSAMRVNPSLNMSPSKWEGSNAVAAGPGATSTSVSASMPAPSASQSHVPYKWPTSDLRGHGDM